jgi:hypothetical protein
MKWQVSLGIGISAVCVWFILARVDFKQLASILQSAHYLFLVLATLIVVATLIIRAWRWGYLLEPVKPVGLLHLLSATAIGFMANMLLPARVGEVVRAYVIAQKEHVSTMASLATIVVERVIDLLSILLVLICILIFTTFPLEMVPIAEGLRMGGYVSGFICLLLVSGLWLLKARTPQMVRLIRGCLIFLPKRWRECLLEALHSFVQGLQAIKRGWHLMSILLLSLCLWAAVALSNFLIFYAFGLRLPFFAAFFILVVQVLSVMVPSSPGFIGTYHAAVVAGLAVFEVTQELALSVAIMMHATFFLPFILIGLFFLWSESFSLRDLRTMKTQSFED